MDARFKIREGIDAVAELPLVIVPVRLGDSRPMAGGMGTEGGVEVAWGDHSKFVRCNPSGRMREGSRGELGSIQGSPDLIESEIPEILGVRCRELGHTVVAEGQGEPDIDDTAESKLMFFRALPNLGHDRCRFDE